MELKVVIKPTQAAGLVIDAHCTLTPVIGGVGGDAVNINLRNVSGTWSGEGTLDDAPEIDVAIDGEADGSGAEVQVTIARTDPGCVPFYDETRTTSGTRTFVFDDRTAVKCK